MTKRKPPIRDRGPYDPKWKKKYGHPQIHSKQAEEKLVEWVHKNAKIQTDPDCPYEGDFKWAYPGEGIKKFAESEAKRQRSECPWLGEKV